MFMSNQKSKQKGYNKQQNFSKIQSNDQCELHSLNSISMLDGEELIPQVLEKNSKFELFMNRKVVKYIGGVLVLAVFLQLLAIFYLYNTKTIINHIFFGKDLPYLNSLFYYGDLSAQQHQAMARSMRFWVLDRQFDIQNNQTLKKFALEEIEYYQNKYKISQFEEIQFCVLVFNENNVAQNRYLYNLNSIVRQNYTNFHVYYIDDHSTDGNVQLVQQYIKNHNLSQKVTLIKNQKNMGKAYNMWTVGKSNCKSGSIMFVVDGDDDLIGRQVFKHFNVLYQTTGAYYIYSIQSFTNKANKKIQTFTAQLSPYSLEHHNYRYNFLPNHQHSWISDIFLDLDIEFYQLDGQFPMTSEDIASNFAMMERSGSRIYHSKQITYHYNQMTGNADQQKSWIKQRIVAFRFRYLFKKAPLYTKQIKFRKNPLETK